MINEEQKGIIDMISIIIPVFNTEEYLREALNAIVEQTYKDFEVIIVNDGSVDGSQQIIDEFCHKDERFHSYYQENSGVSAARNRGIKEAVGDYLFFCDSDDIILHDTIEQLYNTAKYENADMVIGEMHALYLGKSEIVKSSRVLSRKKNIDKLDRNLLYSFAVINKLFRTEIIKENAIEFEEFKLNEDGVFTFSYIKHCNKIAGCSSVVCKYRRRPFWDNNNSLTQQGTKAVMESSMAALDRIKSIIDELFINAEKEYYTDNTNSDYKIFTYNKEKYYSSMYYRFLSISVINNFYRLLWKGEDDLIDYINLKYNEFKSQITSNYLIEALKKNNPDINFEKDLPSKEEIINNPEICFVLIDCTMRNMNTILKGLYDQSMPSFVVYMSEEMKNHTDEFVKEQQNLFSIPDSIFGFRKVFRYIIEHSNSKYIMFIDYDLFYKKNSIKEIYTKMEQNTSLTIGTIELNDLLLVYKDSSVGYLEDSKINFKLGNKLLRRASMKKHNITLQKNYILKWLKSFRWHVT